MIPTNEQFQSEMPDDNQFGLGFDQNHPLQSSNNIIQEDDAGDFLETYSHSAEFRNEGKTSE